MRHRLLDRNTAALHPLALSARLQQLPLGMYFAGMDPAHAGPSIQVIMDVMGVVSCYTVHGARCTAPVLGASNRLAACLCSKATTVPRAVRALSPSSAGIIYSFRAVPLLSTDDVVCTREGYHVRCLQDDAAARQQC